jgi:CRISPR/Cas system-associated protein Cas10 (large subunit of type III CRISPR-Cas system)
MKEEPKSVGRCLYCDTLFSQTEIGKHLAKHLGEMEKASAGKPQSNYCHIEVEAGEMFLHLLVKGDAPMKIIDGFLRDIWLECCGHLSGFGHKNFKIKMKDLVEDVFQPKIKIFHDYDFGTTTRVFLNAKKQYQLNLRDKIILLSRNEPLKLMCTVCKKKPAINLCAVCWYEGPAFYCAACSVKHAETCEDFADYAEMPVVNSPRMGECGYTGGRIDKARDGVYKMP